MFDFYLYEALLPDDERKILRKARAFLRDEVKPMVNRYWDKGEFPMELIEKFRGAG